MDRLLNSHQVAERLNTPESTLRYWRTKGVGPPAALIGRRIAYRERDVQKWLDDQFDKRNAEVA